MGTIWATLRVLSHVSLSVPKSINDANTLEKLVITTYEHRRRRPNIAQCAQKRCTEAPRPSADQREKQRGKDQNEGANFRVFSLELPAKLMMIMVIPKTHVSVDMLFFILVTVARCFPPPFPAAVFSQFDLVISRHSFWPRHDSMLKL